MAVVPKLQLLSRIGEERGLRQSWLGSLTGNRKATNYCTQNRKSKSSRTPLKRPFRAETNPWISILALLIQKKFSFKTTAALCYEKLEKPPANFREILILREREGRPTEGDHTYHRRSCRHRDVELVVWAGPPPDHL